MIGCDYEVRDCSFAPLSFNGIERGSKPHVAIGSRSAPPFPRWRRDNVHRRNRTVCEADERNGKGALIMLRSWTIPNSPFEFQ